jgi:hypothetical protein
VTQPPSPGSAEYLRRTALIETAETRMQQAATFTWAVPTLALAGQAFLLTIALDDKASDWARALSAGAGIVTLVASLQFLAKHTFNFDWHEAVIERERAALNWPSMQRHEILGDLTTFSPNLLLRKREWYAREPGLYEQRLAAEGKELNPVRRAWCRARRPLLAGRRVFAVRTKATWVWTFALLLFLVLDVGLLVDALIDLV